MKKRERERAIFAQNDGFRFKIKWTKIQGELQNSHAETNPSP